MTQEAVSVARNLFDDETYSKILAFMEKELRYMPLAIDDTGFVRKYSHNLPFFTKVHNQLADFASEQFGEKLIPSYSFLSLYEDGGTCPLHIDRPQCYRTIDYLIKQDDPNPWPISISRYMSDEERQKIMDDGESHPVGPQINKVIDSEEWESINLEPNDAVLYSGTNSWHYRPTKLSGTAALVFFHFVPEDFDGPLD